MGCFGEAFDKIFHNLPFVEGLPSILPYRCPGSSPGCLGQVTGSPLVTIKVTGTLSLQ